MGATYHTVGSAVNVEDNKLSALYNDIATAISDIKPFQIRIENFNFMDDWSGGKMGGYTPYVIYLDVVVSPELQQLAENIRDKVTSKRNCPYKMSWPYNPHLTVAYKDLDKDGFEKAKNVLQSRIFKRTSTVNHVALAKELLNGKCVSQKKWNL